MYSLNKIAILELIITLSACINGSHVRIHFYENITTTGCGVGRKGILMNNTCFTYHTSSDTMFAGIQNGRVVQRGETPWTVYITDSLGSCGPNCAATNIRVYPGLTNKTVTNEPYYTSGQYFVHPEYERTQHRPWDLGLIRLNTAIPLDGTSGKTGINSICLPQQMALNANEEYALLNGFGHENENWTGAGIQRLGWTKILKAYSDPNDTMQSNFAMYFKRVPFPSGTATCKGDSGSPIIQFVNGVAVLIGVDAAGMTKHGNPCLPYIEQYEETAVRVSYHIQWIIDNINNNI